MRATLKERFAGAVPPLIAWTVIAVVVVAGLRYYEPVTVSGGSMHPALHAGDIVLVRRGAPIAAGDIAMLSTRRHGDVLHRVTGVSAEGRLTTRGDANPVADFTTLPCSAARGRVELVVPAGSLFEGWR